MAPREPKKTSRWTKDVYMAPQGRSKGVKVEARELQKLEKFVSRNHFKTSSFYSKIEYLEVTVCNAWVHLDSAYATFGIHLVL